MKTTAGACLAIFLLGSCVFDQPFEPEARLSIDPAIAGLWRQDMKDPERESNRLLVLPHSDREWLVQYPVAEADKTMFFRAYPIELAGGRYVQIQLIGTGDGPVKPADRKYHLLKMNAVGDTLEIMTLNAENLGKAANDTQTLGEAFARVKDEPELFGGALRFNRQQ